MSRLGSRQSSLTVQVLHSPFSQGQGWVKVGTETEDRWNFQSDLIPVFSLKRRSVPHPLFRDLVLNPRTETHGETQVRE